MSLYGMPQLEEDFFGERRPAIVTKDHTLFATCLNHKGSFVRKTTCINSSRNLLPFYSTRMAFQETPSPIGWRPWTPAISFEQSGGSCDFSSMRTNWRSRVGAIILITKFRWQFVSAPTRSPWRLIVALNFSNLKITTRIQELLEILTSNRDPKREITSFNANVRQPQCFIGHKSVCEYK